MVKAIGVLVVILVIVYIATSPAHAADMVNSAWGGLAHGAHGIGRFVNKLGS